MRTSRRRIGMPAASAESPFSRGCESTLQVRVIRKPRVLIPYPYTGCICAAGDRADDRPERRPLPHSSAMTGTRTGKICNIRGQIGMPAAPAGILKMVATQELLAPARRAAGSSNLQAEADSPTQLAGTPAAAECPTGRRNRPHPPAPPPP